MPRKQKSDGVFEMLAFAAVVIVVAAIFLFQLVATIAVFGAPIIAFVAYFMFLQPEAPAIPNIADYDNAKFKRKVFGLLRERLSGQQRVDQLFSEGYENGIDLTKGSDYQRFRENSALGRRLNQEIDATRASVDRTEQSIDFVKRAVTLTFPQWEYGVATWVNRQSVAQGVKRSLIYVIPAIMLGYVLPGHARAFQSALLIDPSFNIGPFVFGIGVAYAAFVVHWLLAKEALASTFDRDPFERWSELRQMWSVDARYEDFFPDDPEANHDSGETVDPDEDMSDAPSQELTEQWYDVLQVDRNASISDIKSAYRKQLKQNHPDNVATLGAKIKEAAESQSKLINAAYETAREERDF